MQICYIPAKQKSSKENQVLLYSSSITYLLGAISRIGDSQVRLLLNICLILGAVAGTQGMMNVIKKAKK
ncbi:hypothetical protein PBV87_02945 [Niameybacter massiliensis]|uniref:Uncharacterized protein n=1 Tax=Holtiella tumoricola TaxID=3018743 RepID=A0AA42DK14_9FIRM|nr:hypothetical protein [Holtiella tumoricola]MDA3730463.1 hypothetical protein [Holtiella tumoricola]